MDKFRSWRRWSWDEIYISLHRELGQGEAFEVSRELVEDPLESGADIRPDRQVGWDYRFTSNDGRHLYVSDLGDRYSAYLEEAGPRLGEDWRMADVVAAREVGLPKAAAWGGFMVFLGSLGMVLEATLSRLS